MPAGPLDDACCDWPTFLQVLIVSHGVQVFAEIASDLFEHKLTGLVCLSAPLRNFVDDLIGSSTEHKQDATAYPCTALAAPFPKLRICGQPEIGERVHEIEHADIAWECLI